MVGGGAKSSGAPGTLSLRTSRPYDTSDADSIPSNGWVARAFSTDPGIQELTAYAICARLTRRRLSPRRPSARA